MRYHIAAGREAISRVLHECGVGGYLIRSMNNLYDVSMAYVRMDRKVGNILR